MICSALITYTNLSTMSSRAVTLAEIKWKKKSPFALIVIITDLK